MPFKKGQSGNPKGKPKGAQDKVTKTVKEVFASVLEQFDAQTILKLIAQMEAKDQIAALTKMAEFVAPKMKSIDIPQMQTVVNPVIDVIKKLQDEKKKE